jgi:uncharacterized membrane protein
MRIFTLLDFHHLVLALFLGFITALSIYLGFRHHSRPVPAVLVFIYIGFAIWAVFYVILFGIFGGPL